ncbi:DUF6320 domain-containing protein [[Clostridium] symbiosum]|uniref:DUF6320 domain-containing protein n=1 Tax=Clostridium symbiosum TaxID=1512 RepID=UPI001D06FC3D|nr:DUF6320 domain-containing protein [[Clostridium] symbiosum]MCB6610437.1 DUF6320 domain-containing protein [[Clostridium] symbiosum]MCB6931592.1 DUF6320 domain-containing protein [[Clostridium] symbiosum]
MDEKDRVRPRIQGARWRKLDNTAKLFAAVAGEDLSNVFRLSVSLKNEIKPELLEQALKLTLPEFENFRVKLRKGFFWNYFETNNREPLVEKEETYPCKYIDPHASHRFPFRVSYYGRRINFEVFHGLTDGLGALNFLKKMTEHYLDLYIKVQKKENSQEAENAGLAEAAGKTELTQEITGKTEQTQEITGKIERMQEDGYLRHYSKRPHKRYETEQALSIEGEYLPLDCQSVLHGSIPLDALKAVCRKEGVSITKYLTAALIWSLIQVYTDGKTLKRPAALNLPINLRSFFDSETMANFFSVTNIAWPAGKAPERFEDVLAEVGRQMDEKIVKERLEETISYNVSNEKKWYVRIVPLFVKNIAMNAVFLKSSKAYTMTLSNLGPVSLKPEYEDMVENFHVLIGVSRQQKMKCGVIAFRDKLYLSFNSAVSDLKMQEYFFRFLEERGAAAELESNGAVEQKYDKGNYPSISYDRGKLKKLTNILYLVLFTAAAITGLVNVLTYGITETWWSLIAIGSIAYVAMTLRYSIMRRASLAGILIRQSLGVQVLLVIIDYMTGFSRWSFNYAIPSLILFDVIAVVFLILINRLNWQSYFMYQIAITIFSFIPLILWAAGLITSPLMSIITVILSVSVLFITIILGDRSVKKELKRRFYF